MKKTVGLISLIIFCFCFLTGCGENEILKKEGEVYNKEFRIATETVEHEVYNGVTREYSVAYPDIYVIYVKYREDFGNEENPFYKTYAFYVSKDIYEKTNIGDKYLYNIEKDSLEANYISRKEIEND